MLSRTDKLGFNVPMAFIAVIGIVFAIRGVTIFPFLSRAVIPLITTWDVLALILSGIFLSFLVIKGYPKIAVVFVALSWFLYLLVIAIILFSALACWKEVKSKIYAYYDSLHARTKKLVRIIVILVIISGILILIPLVLLLSMLVSFFIVYTDSLKFICPFIVLFSFSISYILVESLNSGEKGKFTWKGPFITFRDNSEAIFGMLMLFFLVLAFFSPPLLTNRIAYDYEGSQELIDSYLDLEINSYLTGIQGIADHSCSGSEAFRLAPNFLGSTERSSYETSILTSKFKAKTSIYVNASERNELAGQEILQLVKYSFYYQFGYWNDTLHLIEDGNMTQISGLSWSGDSIYLIQEIIEMDNAVGSHMKFYQIVAYLPANNSVLVILSGHLVMCYD